MSCASLPETVTEKSETAQGQRPRRHHREWARARRACVVPSYEDCTIAQLLVSGCEPAAPRGMNSLLTSMIKTGLDLGCGPAPYCFVTLMLLALLVSVYPAVTLVNDPLIEPAVRAVYIAPDFGGRLG